MSLQNVHAIVVGVEDYGLGTRWELNGPAFDAVRMAAWLAKAGVPGGQIHLALKPLAANAQDMEALIQASRLEGCHRIAPTNSELGDFLGPPIRKQLAKGPAPEILLIFWAGHGAMRPTGGAPDRVLFFADMEDVSHPFLPVEPLARWLTTILPRCRLVFIADACSIDIARMNLARSMVPREFPKGDMVAPGRRLMLYGSAEGQTAANNSARREGLFTSALLAQLHDFQPATADDFMKMESIIQRTREQVLQDSRNKQLVVTSAFDDWEGSHNEAGSARQDSATPGDEAAQLCDRDEQWIKFKEQAEAHRIRAAVLPFVTIAHGRANQSPAAFFKNLEHQAGESPAFLNGCRSVAGVKVVPTLHPGMSTDDLEDELRERVRYALQIEAPDGCGKDVLNAKIAESISMRTKALLFALVVESRTLGDDPAARLSHIVDCLRAFAPISGRAMAAFVIFVAYPRSRWTLSLRDLLGWGERKVRHAIRKQSSAVIPELGHVTQSDVFVWGEKMSTLVAGWRPPTDGEIREVLSAGTEWPMDTVVPALERLIEKRRQRAPAAR